MIKDMIFGTVGGLGLFLFGMGLMSDGLKKVAGQKLKSLLESLTKHRIIAVIVGALTVKLGYDGDDGRICKRGSFNFKTGIMCRSRGKRGYNYHRGTCLGACDI